MFVAPMDADGVKLISRASYEMVAGATGSPYDYPLSSRFDENDAILVMDNVLIPWENVLIYRDFDRCRRWTMEGGFARMYPLQACVRLAVKLDFITALLKKSLESGGTGDLTAKFSRLVGETGKVVLADINESMLKMGREKLRNIGVIGNVEYVQANAEALPFPDNTFDCITISFGLRNVTDKDKALRSMYRVLKPGGRLLVLEFSKPIIEPLSKAYDAYSFHVLPRIGSLVANDADSYRYLAESIRMHPDQDTLKAMMQDAGFESVDYYNLTAGVVALHRGYKF